MKHLNILKALLLWCLTGVLLHAQSAYDAIRLTQGEMGFGSRALAMGGAYAGLADDYTAVYWNPAGLGLMKKYQFFAEFSNLSFTNRALFARELTVDTQTYTRLRSMGLAVPVPTRRGSLVLAVGYNRILSFDDNLVFSGFSSESNGLAFDITDDRDITDTYPFDRNVTRSENVTSEGGLRQLTAGAALALSPRFLVGAAVNYVVGAEDYHSRFVQDDTQDQYTLYPGDFHRYQMDRYLQSTHRALVLRIGGLIHLKRGLRIGGAATLPSPYHVQEVHSSADELTFDDGFVDEAEDNGQWDYTVSTPPVLDAGMSQRIGFLTLSASLRYRDWSQTRFRVSGNDLADSDYRQLLEENAVIRQDYRPTLEYRLGGEISLRPVGTTIRGGYALLPSPLRQAGAERDREFLTGGFSYALDRDVHLDMTYLFGRWERETRDSFTPGGTLEDITIGKLLVGLSYDF
ncbi:MAG: OmpP1/FadL family transporter [Fidelibacterota bacterium]